MKIAALLKFLFTVVNCLIIRIKAETLTSTTGINTEVDFVPVTNEPLEYLPSARIVGGKNAADGQFPHQVSLRENGAHICGGSIISPNYVVTAAHCVTVSTKGGYRAVPASYFTIRAGSTLVNSGGVIVKANQIKVHPQYRNFANDIALVKLEQPLKYDSRTKAIPLATAEVPAKSKVIISGWGRLRGNGPTPVYLQYNTLDAITRAECQRQIGSVPASILCLDHRSGNGACQGDSGGPAVFNGQLVGVTNFVIDNCGTNAPDGYAKISSFNKWLKQNSDL